MTRITVLHVAESFGAGTLSAIIHICKSTDDSIRHIVAYSTRSETPADVETLFPSSVELIHVPMCREIRPSMDIRAFRELFRLIRNRKPEVVHAHSAKAGVLGRMAAWLCGTPSVYTPHGFAFLREDISPRKRKLYWVLEWVAAKFGTLIVACGETEAFFARRFGKADVVCNGIDLSRMPYPPDRASKVGPVRAGICGRVAPQRDPEVLGQLADSTKQTIEWLWIGDGDEPDKTPLRNVQVTGWVTRDVALQHMKDLDIYVQSSRWEGLPFSVMEAMALELPVVATNIIGNSELVVHGETGFLADSAEDMLAYVRQLASDSELRIGMGRKGRRRIEKMYDANVTMQQFGGIYSQLARK